jgi:hypothetical protein
MLDAMSFLAIVMIFSLVVNPSVYVGILNYAFSIQVGIVSFLLLFCYINIGRCRNIAKLS